MLERIDSLGPMPIRPDGVPSAGTPASTGGSFKDVLFDSIRQVNELQQDAQKAVEGLATGQNDNLAQVMTAVQKADLAFRTLMQIRNKLVDAYQEIRQMRL